MPDFIRLVQDEISSVTGLAHSDLDVDAAFVALGIESLQAVTIATNLSQSLKREIPVTSFFDYPSIREFAGFLENGNKPAAPISTQRAASNEPIAIVGMAGRFPGAENIDQFWQNLTEGVDAIRETPLRLWNWRANPDQPALRWGGFLDDVDSFDHELFDIPASEAERMDPQQRILLQCVHEAIENAGLSVPSLAKTRTGVFVGISSSDFSGMQIRQKKKASVFDATGNAHSVAANRISYLFNLRGPSLSVDTACSSSLVALHEACLNLQAGECDLAIVAGVNVILDSEITKAFAEAGMLAPDGRCKTFSQEANGYVRGEGVAAIVLQRASQASHKNAYAVIRSVAVNQDGKTNGLTAPSGPAQEAVIRQALSKAKITSDQIDFLEAHGTGTALGDPIEFLTLSRIFSSQNREKQLSVGSAKAFIGHLEAAAGMAGLIKVALSLHHRQIPKQIHFTSINPKMEEGLKHLNVITESAHLAEGRKYLAGVSSFGFGGTNAHAILESAPAPALAEVEVLPASTPLVIAFSATHPESLQEAGKRWLALLRSPDSSVSELASRSVVERLAYKHRVAIFGRSREELIEALEAWRAKKPGDWVEKELPRHFVPKLAFAFTGQGSQFPGMALGLAKSDPRFRIELQRVLSLLEGYFPEPLLKVMEAADKRLETLLYQTDYGQSLLFALEVALAKYLEPSLGAPALVFGHSLGEISAASYAKSISVESAARLVAARGKLMQESTQEGAMISVRGDGAQIRKFLADRPIVDLAAQNGPNLFTLSGSADKIREAIPMLEQLGAKAKQLPVTRAFHSSLMDSMLAPFSQILSGLKFQDPEILLISSLTAQAVKAGEYSAQYWARQARETTQFQGMMEEVAKNQINVVVEIGPGPVLSAMGPACVPNSKIFWVSPLQRGKPDAWMRSLAELALLGVSSSPSPKPNSHSIALPPTPFRKKFFRSSEVSVPTSVLAEIQSLVASLLHMKPEEVSPDAHLVDLGADSLLLLNAIQTVQDRYGVSIAIADVFRELNTVRAISDFIDSKRAKPAAPVPQAPATTTQEWQTIATANTEALLSSAAWTGDLRGIVESQLSLMRQQLNLLQGMPASASPQPSAAPQAPVPVPTAVAAPKAASPAPASSVEAKGVLGNWRAKANREVSADEAAKATYLKNFVEHFAARTKTSKSHTQKYRKNLADNRLSAGFRPNLKEMIYTIVFHSGKGAHFRDLDGNDYIDFTMGFGVNFFGHGPDFIEDKMKAQINQGYCVGPQAELAGVVAEKACRLLKHDRIAFLNSGTEAVMTSIRLARAVTKRNRIAIFEGSYHGHSDVVLARTGAQGGSLPVAPGVPTGIVGDVVVLPYGDASSLEYLRKHSGELAAVLVEPVQSRYPEHQPVEFLREIRSITEKTGTAFIFDEVICGLRMAPGGAHEVFGIEPDLAVYGKVLGGGMPIGAVAGKAKFLDPIDGGHWSFGDDSYPGAEMTFFAGTFCKHPVTMAAVDAVLDRFLAEGKKLTSELNERTAKLCERLNREFEGIDMQANHFGSLFRFKSQSNIDLFFAHLNLRGIYIWEGRNLFLSTAHSEKDLDTFLAIVRETVAELTREGFFRKKT